MSASTAASLPQGALFVALRGPNHDAHAFVPEALAAGAAAMVSRLPDGVGDDAPIVLVQDTLAALEALGRAGRARSTARIVGVTGSVGKTSTKEALRHVLAGAGPTHASAASHNNHWGVPLSLARLPRDGALRRLRDGHEPCGRDRGAHAAGPAARCR